MTHPSPPWSLRLIKKTPFFSYRRENEITYSQYVKIKEVKKKKKTDFSVMITQPKIYDCTDAIAVMLLVISLYIENGLRNLTDNTGLSASLSVLLQLAEIGWHCDKRLINNSTTLCFSLFVLFWIVYLDNGEEPPYSGFGSKQHILLPSKVFKHMHLWFLVSLNEIIYFLYYLVQKWYLSELCFISDVIQGFILHFLLFVQWTACHF